MDDALVKKLLSSMKCGACGDAYERENLSVLAHIEDLWLISAFCPSCSSRGLVAVVIRKGKVEKHVSNSIEGDFETFEGLPIDVDDVLDMHSFLKDFSGDVSDLLCEQADS